MWFEILRSRNIDHITYWKFIRLGFLVTPVVIASACGVLSLEHALWPKNLQ
jgi:Na+/H+ antiporter NhaD/arsenite permease-like protein